MEIKDFSVFESDLSPGQRDASDELFNKFYKNKYENVAAIPCTSNGTGSEERYLRKVDTDLFE